MLKFLARKSRAESKTLLLYKNFIHKAVKFRAQNYARESKFMPKTRRTLSCGFKTKSKFAPLNFNPRSQNQAKFHAEFHF